MALITKFDGYVYALFRGERLIAGSVRQVGFFVTVINADLLIHAYNYSLINFSPETRRVDNDDNHDH